MNPNKIISKAVALVVLAVIATCLMQLDHAHGARMGREAFLEKESIRYDRHFVHQDSLLLGIFASLSLLGVLLASYEIIAFVTLKILEKINPIDTTASERTTHEN